MATIEERDGEWWLHAAPDEQTQRLTAANEGPFMTRREAELHQQDFERISRDAHQDEVGDGPAWPYREERSLGDDL